MPTNSASGKATNNFVSRKQAIEQNLKYYIGEKPCTTCGYNFPLRLTSCSNCVSCLKEYDKKRWAAKKGKK